MILILSDGTVINLDFLVVAHERYVAGRSYTKLYMKDVPVGIDVAVKYSEFLEALRKAWHERNATDGD